MEKENKNETSEESSSWTWTYMNLHLPRFRDDRKVSSTGRNGGVVLAVPRTW